MTDGKKAIEATELPMGERIREAFGDDWKRVSHAALERLGIFEAYSRPFTVSDLSKIRRHAQGDHGKTLVYTVIFKLVGPDGEALFSLKDKPDLENYFPSDALAEITEEINKAGGFDDRPPGK
jgi:hypothetical protein